MRDEILVPSIQSPLDLAQTHTNNIQQKNSKSDTAATFHGEPLERISSAIPTRNKTSKNCD